MKTGYPFLKIAQKHNLDYGDVLKAADYNRNMGSGHIGTEKSRDEMRAFMSIPSEAMRDMLEAYEQMRDLQSGVRDFSKGHYISGTVPA